MNRAKRFASRNFGRAWSHFHRRLVPDWITSRYSPGPQRLLVQLTYKCNLRCSFCGQWGDTGIFKNLPSAQLREMLPLAVLQRVIDELPWSCRGACLWGGETLQYPEIVALVRSIKASGRGCHVITNGTFLAEHARALVDAGLDSIGISLDAGEETHDRMRGARGTFQAALQGIRILREERKARGSQYPKIVVGAVLLPEAAGELPELIRQVRAEGVDHFTLGRLQFTTEQQGKSHDEAFQKLFQITPVSWKGFLRHPQPGTQEKMRAVVEELRADPANKDFIKWDEALWSPQDFFNYYVNPASAIPAGRACRFPWDSICICPNGDVTPCPDYPDVVVGNVNETSIGKIWNGPRYLEFRRKLAEQGRFPICTSCCHLYDD